MKSDGLYKIATINCFIQLLPDAKCSLFDIIYWFVGF